LLDAFEARGGDPAVLRPLMGVRPEYLDAALLETRRTYGDLERYFSVGLGLEKDVRQRLRAAFVERR
jgi:protein-tyrosine phosphatase